MIPKISFGSRFTIYGNSQDLKYNNESKIKKFHDYFDNQYHACEHWHRDDKYFDPKKYAYWYVGNCPVGTLRRENTPNGKVKVIVELPDECDRRAVEDLERLDLKRCNLTTGEGDYCQFRKTGLFEASDAVEKVSERTDIPQSVLANFLHSKEDRDFSHLCYIDTEFLRDNIDDKSAVRFAQGMYLIYQTRMKRGTSLNTICNDFTSDSVILPNMRLNENNRFELEPGEFNFNFERYFNVRRSSYNQIPVFLDDESLEKLQKLNRQRKAQGKPICGFEVNMINGKKICE